MPLKTGYGRKTINKNVREMVRSGKSRDQAVAAALSAARRHYRRKFPNQDFPGHLKTQRG